MNAIRWNLKWVAVAVTAALTACGGGGSPSTPGTPGSSVDLILSGTAATGKAIAGASVQARCQIGSASTTTIADGSYRLVVVGGEFPCVLEVVNPADATRLHTVVTGSGNAATANITPLTEMLSGRVLGNEPAVFFAAFEAAIATRTLTAAAVKAAQTEVGSVLSGSVDTSSLGDFIATPLKAATPDNLSGGDAQDKLLDALRTKFNGAQLTQVVAALAHIASIADIKQVVLNLAAAAPVADAGVAQSVMAGTVVTLDASASSAPVGGALTYTWTMAARPAGSAATLSSSASARPSFTADAAGTYVASVVVNDGRLNSGAAAVSITAAVGNAAPVASAGVAQSVVTGSVVTLDGSASSDANGDALTYAWTLTAKPAGSSATLSSSTSAKPTFKADLTGTYVASIVVNDGKVNGNAAAVSITAAVVNAAPVANAGGAQNVVVGNVVTLDGSASSDANSDPLTYAWTLTAKPGGSTAILASSSSAKPAFSADVAGTYVATLIVNDGKVNGNAATVSVTAAVANVAPVANAGLGQNVLTDALVALDGSASSDANGDSLTYAWTLTAKPAGSAASLVSSASAKPTFRADVAGVYVASVIVNDGKANSNAATVSVTASVANAAPVANAGVGQSVTAGEVVTLNGSASSDANGDALTYTWALMAKPAGSMATLTGANTAAPSFGADLAGTYVASLSVNDGKISSPASTVSIAAAAANSVPVFSAMSSHNTNFGIGANGDLWGWGWNGHGELGNANTTDTLKPALLGHGYASISGSYGGESFTLAVKSDGTLLAWGINLFNTGGPDALTPQVIGTGGFASVSASTYFQAALKTDGSLWTWGRNDSGLAGDGSTVPIPAPKQIGTNFATVSAGAIHAMAVKKDGSLWAWGSGTCGALATNQNQNLNVPTQIGVGYRDALAMSGYATIALKTDGTLWSWGGTYNGVLGDGVSAANCRNTPLQIGSGFTAIARGYSYAIALKADGSVWSWGHLSISTRDTGADSLIPRQIGTGFVKIFMGSWRAYAVSADGGLWAWGDSHDYGFANTMGYSAVPVRVN